MDTELKIASFNCSNVKSSVPEINLLCQSHDIVLLQETWFSVPSRILMKVFMLMVYLNHAADKFIPHSGNSNAHNIPGWNEFVKAAHNKARHAVKQWASVSKPKQGPFFRSMQSTRAHFKYTLRWCKNNERTLKADALASDLINKDVIQFWKHVDTQSTNKLPLANTVGGATGHNDIANMWHNHFRVLFSSVKSDTNKEMK